MHVLGAIAEFERARIAERVKAGLMRAKAQGSDWDATRKTPAVIGGPSVAVRETGLSWGRLKVKGGTLAHCRLSKGRAGHLSAVSETSA